MNQKQKIYCFIFAGFFDLITTVIGLLLGFTEANPFLLNLINQFGIGSFILVKLIAIYILVKVSIYFMENEFTTKVVLFPFYICGIVWFVAGLNNIFVIVNSYIIFSVYNYLTTFLILLDSYALLIACPIIIGFYVKKVLSLIIYPNT